MNVRNTSLPWFRCCRQVILGVASGAALFIFCLISLIEFLSFWALPVGSFSALAIWVLIVAINAVHMRFRGWNFARIQFLSGLGIIPCYFGISMIIIVSIEGMW